MRGRRPWSRFPCFFWISLPFPHLPLPSTHTHSLSCSLSLLLDFPSYLGENKTWLEGTS